MGVLDDIKKNITKGSEKAAPAGGNGTDSKNVSPTEPIAQPEPTPTINKPGTVKPDAGKTGAAAPNAGTPRISTPDLPPPPGMKSRESIKRADAKRGIHREENIFSFRGDGKPKKSVIEEEKAVYNRVHDTKELGAGAGTKTGTGPAAESKAGPEITGAPAVPTGGSPDGVAEKRGAMHQLKRMAEESKADTVPVVGWKRSPEDLEEEAEGEKGDEEKEERHEDDYGASIRTVPGKENQSITYSWESQSPIEAPRESDFISRAMRSVPTAKGGEKAGSLGWERKDVAGGQTPEEMAPRKTPEIEHGAGPGIGWRNGTKPEEDINAGEGKGQAPEEFTWLGEEKIEEPKPEDFTTAEPAEGMAAGETKAGKPGAGSGDAVPEGEPAAEEKPKEKKKGKGPKWLKRGKKKKEDAAGEKKTGEAKNGGETKPAAEADDAGVTGKQEDSGVTKEDLAKSAAEEKAAKGKKGEEGKKDDKKQVSWLEGDIEESSLEEDVMEEMKGAIGGKWASKKKVSAKGGEERRPEALSTPIDKMFDLLSSYKEANSTEVAEFSGLTTDEVEIIARKFEEEGIVELKYYTTPGKRPGIIFKEDVPSAMREIPKGKVIDKYRMVVDFVDVLVTIVEVKGEPRPIYTLGTPHMGKFTRKFLDMVKDEVAETMPIELEEILDPRKSKKLKVRFFKELTKNLKRYLSSAPDELLNPLSGLILHELYGLGDIELFMADDMLEEVAINSAKTPLTIYHRVYGWMKTNVFIDSEERIVNYAAQIGRKVGREITVLKPILDAHLLSGDRVNSTLFPVSSEGNTLTIRRFARRPWTIIDFVGKAHTMNTEMAALLWIAMQYEMNVLVAGGTASGKTSALNTLLAMVPPYHRLISIEDVREIVLPKYLLWNWVPLVTRSPNPEGLGEVTMLELMLSSLRMRPDRIIVGEIRRHREAEVLMESIETGHSIYSTMHANSAYQVLRRLVEPPMNIPPLQVELLDIVVVQYRDRKSNKRRTYEISEIEQTSSGQGLQINTIYKWSPRTDTWDKLAKPVKLLTLLNLHTGLTEEDIMNEMKDRKMIVEWMRDNRITSLDDIGLVMKIFYSDADRVKRLARKNTSLEEFKKAV